MMITLIQRRDGRTIQRIQVQQARTFWRRLVGLLTTRQLAPYQGLLLHPCRSVHTLWMRMTIDVVFLDAQGIVIRCVKSLSPYRFAQARGAQQVLELGEGGIDHFDLHIGDQLKCGV